MKLLRHKVGIHIEGTVSQIFRMGPRFYEPVRCYHGDAHLHIT